MNMMNVESNRKIPLRAFFKGFASAFDLWGRSFVQEPDISRGFERDGAALRGDWDRVGADMKKALSLYSYEQ